MGKMSLTEAAQGLETTNKSLEPAVGSPGIKDSPKDHCRSNSGLNQVEQNCNYCIKVLNVLKILSSKYNPFSHLSHNCLTSLINNDR